MSADQTSAARRLVGSSQGLAETPTSATQLELENERLRVELSHLAKENREARQQAVQHQRTSTQLEAELQSSRGMLADLREEVAHLRRELERSTAQYREAEAQHDRLASLFVAVYRLSESTDREELFLALQEIIINLIGSEKFAILEQEDQGLRVASSFGLGRTAIRKLDPRQPPIAGALESGEVFLAPEESEVDEPQPAEIVACVPLRASGKIQGAIAIFSLLSHKEELGKIDRDLLDLLASHVGSSMLLTRPTSEPQPTPAGPESAGNDQ